MTAAHKLRELLASRPAMPSLEELTRWWRMTTGEMLPEVLELLEGATKARAELVVALDAALCLADVPEHVQDDDWYARRESLGHLQTRHECACPSEALEAARGATNG